MTCVGCCQGVPRASTPTFTSFFLVMSTHRVDIRYYYSADCRKRIFRKISTIIISSSSKKLRHQKNRKTKSKTKFLRSRHRLVAARDKGSKKSTARGNQAPPHKNLVYLLHIINKKIYTYEKNISTHSCASLYH